MLDADEASGNACCEKPERKVQSQRNDRLYAFVPEVLASTPNVDPESHVAVPLFHSTDSLSEGAKFFRQRGFCLFYTSDAADEGLGVDFDESEASKYQYKRSYLPISRLEDGTLWDW